ncbi:MAG: LysR family transcriptional regulator substrate-binding protein [Acidimicrobiales bacterium]
MTGVEIVLHEAHNPRELLDMVEGQELDITFCSGSVAEVEGPFRSRLVLEDPFALLAPATPEWAGRHSVTMEEIATHPLIGNRNPTCYGQALQTFGDLQPNFVSTPTTTPPCRAAWRLASACRSRPC